MSDEIARFHLSFATVMEVMPLASPGRVKLCLPHLNFALDLFRVNTPPRLAAFLATMGHESGDLRYTEELADGWAYDISVNPKLAAKLGNTTVGDGPRYKGRGPFQLTGLDNYRRCSTYLNDLLQGTGAAHPTVDFVSNPEHLAKPEYGFLGAGWFWSDKNLTPLADRKNFRELTRLVNGGYTHWEDRLRRYNLACRVFKVGAS